MNTPIKTSGRAGWLSLLAGLFIIGLWPEVLTELVGMLHPVAFWIVCLLVLFMLVRWGLSKYRRW